MGLFFPRDEHTSERMREVMDDYDGDSPYWKWVFVGGWLVLAAFGLLIILGWPGAGIVLVPIGLCMILGSGIQLLMNRIHI
jgi:hypothetical protein